MLEKMTEFEVDGLKYPVVFNLNVMEKIQDEYETIGKWSDLIDRENEEINVKALKFGIGAMINEGLDIENEKIENKKELLSDKEIGRLITNFGINNLTKKAMDTIIESTQVEEKNV